MRQQLTPRDEQFVLSQFDNCKRRVAEIYGKGDALENQEVVNVLEEQVAIEKKKAFDNLLKSLNLKQKLHLISVLKQSPGTVTGERIEKARKQEVAKRSEKQAGIKRSTKSKL